MGSPPFIKSKGGLGLQSPYFSTTVRILRLNCIFSGFRSEASAKSCSLVLRASAPKRPGARRHRSRSDQPGVRVNIRTSFALSPTLFRPAVGRGRGAFMLDIYPDVQCETLATECCFPRRRQPHQEGQGSRVQRRPSVHRAIPPPAGSQSQGEHQVPTPAGGHFT